MPISVRLDTQTETVLRHLARRRGLTRSEIVREALKTLTEKEETLGRPRLPYEAMAPYLGCAKGGPPDLSERTGRRFREALHTRRQR